MSLMHFQVKLAGRCRVCDAPILGMTSVAFHHFAHREIEHEIDERRGKKNDESGNQPIVEPRNTAKAKPEYDDRYP